MPAEKPDLHAIFNDAIALASEEDRARYLEQACGVDAQLKAKVQALLRAHSEAGDFFGGKPTESGATLVHSLSERPGSIIGPYKLLQQIGEGGMGTVFMAEQSAPVERRVALKVIKPGMDSRQVISRFEAERQALALMDHPNIAKVLDAGTTDTGRPYFVMELIKGQPITQYCDEHHLTPRQRLELLLPVCQAIQHAHQKGIIHRDLKPTNILVAEYDNQPVPKVIDFGVAKATSQRLTEKTMFTGYGQIVGTLEYMSPEQAKVNQLDIDTRSDIYSLGVILYELLTGSTPFDKQRLCSAALDEMLRVIREEEPERPSIRLSSAEMLPSIAANRNMEPNRLSGLVRGELDWIVMKALEKDRNRRYETANGFAMDVQRYLADEPVQACPPSSRYRLQKFVRRNKGPVGAASVVLVVLVAGIIGTTWGMVRAIEARREAVDQTEQKEQALKEKESALVKAKASAEDAHRKTRLATAAQQEAKESAANALREATTAKAIQKLLEEMLSSAGDGSSRGANFTLNQLLDEFLTRFDKQLSAQPDVEAAIRLTIAKLYTTTSDTRNNFQAVRQLKIVLDLQKRASVQPPVLAETLYHYAWTLAIQKKYVEAEGHAREALAIYQELGEETSPQSQLLWALHQILLCETFRLQGKAEESEQAMVRLRRECVKRLVSDQRDLQGLFSLEGITKFLIVDLKRPADAEALMQEAAAVVRERNVQDQTSVVHLLCSLAQAKLFLGRHAEAETLLREALAMAGRLNESSAPKSWRLYNLGWALYSQGKYAEAEPQFLEALLLFRKYNSGTHFGVRLTLMFLIKTYAKQGKHAEAAELASEAARVIESSLASWPQELASEAPRKLAGDLNGTAWAIAVDPDVQPILARLAVKLAKQAVDLSPNDWALVNTLGTAYYRAGEWQECIDTLTRADELGRGAQLGHNGFFIAMAHWQLGDRDKARKWLDNSVEWMEKNARENKELQQFQKEADELIRPGECGESVTGSIT